MEIAGKLVRGKGPLQRTLAGAIRRGTQQPLRKTKLEMDIARTIIVLPTTGWHHTGMLVEKTG